MYVEICPTNPPQYVTNQPSTRDQLILTLQSGGLWVALQVRRGMTCEAISRAGLAQSLRLPDSPELPTTAKVDPESQRSDGVFLHLVSLPKGLTLFAHMLPLLPTNATSLRCELAHAAGTFARDHCDSFPSEFPCLSAHSSTSVSRQRSKHYLCVLD